MRVEVSPSALSSQIANQLRDLRLDTPRKVMTATSEHVEARVGDGSSRRLSTCGRKEGIAAAVDDHGGHVQRRKRRAPVLGLLRCIHLIHHAGRVQAAVERRGCVRSGHVTGARRSDDRREVARVLDVPVPVLRRRRRHGLQRLRLRAPHRLVSTEFRSDVVTKGTQRRNMPP